MKKFTTVVLSATLIGGMLLQTACFGSFKLTNKFYGFHKSLGNKYVTSILFWFIWPAYGFCTFVDAIVFNAIEFWTGANPLTMQTGQTDTKTIVSNGKTYQISAMQNKFVIKEIAGPDAGKVVELAYNPLAKTWAINGQGESHLLTQELADGSINVFSPNGNVQNYVMNGNSFAQTQVGLHQ